MSIPPCQAAQHAPHAHHHDQNGRFSNRWLRFLLPLTGGLALIWFLLRVVPKPTRATYPCQRVAMPLAGGFLTWLAGLTVSVFAFRQSRILWKQSRVFAAMCCLGLAVVVGGAGFLVQTEQMVLADSQVPNDPIGIARGTHPGRVAWVYDPEATDWEGPGYGHWWQEEHTSQAVVDQMMSRAVQSLSGVNDDAAAWVALFQYFNQSHGQGNIGYQPGEKIAIKVNFVGFHWLWGGVDPDTYNITSRYDYMNTSPQMIRALLRQLVYEAGVAQSDISVGDPNGLFPNQYYNMCHVEFPDVHYLDHNGGNASNPRTGVEFSAVPFYWSNHPTGVQQDYVPVSFAEATYLINLANFKSHGTAGVTLCAKNHFGSLIRWPGQSGYFDMHPSLAHSSPEEGSYRALVDFMGHAHAGGKTLIYLVDGLYAGVHSDESSPRKWEAPPFNGDWTSSLFASQDPVAIESVCFDFMQQEDGPYYYPRMQGADDYLSEAALADNPPSGTFYDPDHEGDVQRLTSLGVHEHWNNPVQMQYSRNLGTGEGIELMILHVPTTVGSPGPVRSLHLTCYPNPFNPRTTLSFQVPYDTWVQLDVFEVDGGKVVTLVDDQLVTGLHEVMWDGRDISGRPVPSGVYFYRVTAGDLSATQRMVLIR